MVVLKNEKIAEDIFEMKLDFSKNKDGNSVIIPGQFINIAVPGFVLRRPISIADVDEEGIKIVFKVVGDGTKRLSKAVIGDELDVLYPLGNGYKLNEISEAAILVGGGIGVPPLYYLAKKMLETGKKPSVLIGVNTAKELFYVEKFENLGVDVSISSLDGSVGQEGYVTELEEFKNIKNKPYNQQYVVSCGPKAMLKAVADKSPNGQYSFEERMACGFGACMGCSIMTKSGAKRVCKDGPVFLQEDIIWEEI